MLTGVKASPAPATVILFIKCLLSMYPDQIQVLNKTGNEKLEIPVILTNLYRIIKPPNRSLKKIFIKYQ